MRNVFDDNKNKYDIESKITPTWCVASLTTTPTIGTNFIVPLNNIQKSGNLTLQNDGVRIGADIHHIKVSGDIFLDNWVGGSYYLWAQIRRYRGNDHVIFAGTLSSGGAPYISSPVPNAIIDVQEGDIIKLVADSGGSGTIRGYSSNTWLCIEKLD